MPSAQTASSKHGSKPKLNKQPKPDLLEETAAPRTFENLDVRATLDCVEGSKLCDADVKFCTELLADTMQMLHKSTKGAHGMWDSATQKDFLKRLREPKSRVFMIRSTDLPKEDDDDWILIEGNGEEVVPTKECKSLGFLHMQLSMERSSPALVVFEMQLIPELRGKGVGKHVMQLMQTIATKMGFSLVLYNNFKATARALQQVSRADDASEMNTMMAPMVKAH